MLVTIIRYIFVINAVLLGSMIVYGKLFVFKKKKPQFVSDYCATIAGLIGAYSLLSIALAWFLPGTNAKLLMLGFAVAPFLIGLLASYHTEKYYTAVQVILIALSAAFVLS
ncbi:MAG: hypothetical protein K6E29_03315 [Cyanobacteria bacterium RUI128]|nr:hypothetical protein [Cyanobacteria bacterium RUI128]